MGASQPKRADRSVEEILRILYDAGRRLHHSLNPDVLFRTLVEIVGGVMPCDGLVVSTYSPEDDLIRCIFASVGGTLHDPTSFPALPLNRMGGMQSQVIVQAKPMMFDVVEKVRQGPEGHYKEVSPDGSVEPVNERDPITKSALMAPMMLEDQVTGVVQVMSDLAHAYSDDDLNLLEGLVLQLSPAVNNTILYTRLQASQQSFKELIDSLPLIAWAIRPDRKPEYLNRYYYEYTGQDPESGGPAGWSSVVHPHDRAAGMQAIARSFELGTAWEQEIRLRNAQGEFRWHLSRMVPVRNEAGVILRWLGTSTDIHAQKETETELERRVEGRTRELQEAIRELEGFTYTVSHDLRSPLRAIVSTSAMLLHDYSEALVPEAQLLLDRQANSAKRMAILIDELLRLSRVGRQEMLIAPIDLTRLAEDVAAEIKADKPDLEVEFDIAAGLTAVGDAKLVRLVLSNLFENSCKFSPGKALVQFARDEKGFFVQDNGIGIDMQFVNRLFRPFERLVRDDEFEGTGIGLANVKRIIDRHGGKVWVESTPGQGSRFYFTLAR